MYHYYPSKKLFLQILLKMHLIYKTIETSERFKQTCCLIAQAENSTVVPVDAKKRIDEKKDLPYKIIADIMNQGQNEGSIVDGDAYELAILFWTSINGLSIYRETRKEPGKMPDYKLLSAMFLKENRMEENTGKQRKIGDEII